MSGSINKVIIIGNLGADPEIRRTQDGRMIVSIRIATSETWRDRNTNERREKTEWHNVVIFNEGLCKIAEQYLTKGSKVYIEGQLQTRKWKDQNGNDRYTTEIVLQGFNSTLTMLDTRGENNNFNKNRSSGYMKSNDEFGENSVNGGSTLDREGRDDIFSNELDDEIPF
ncbi:Single-stranded DNA-binding protein [Liberibacter crescens BT-1]|uniref:Single-stranded DNA-binding protein n=1 Tax=Liberibacter crescens (strain BT-1) TaxID=1215343 RepID=L0EU44_LIBCB|nr:single-stranded DNA-binding protein [Liberibacter crescens]AGA64375.1 Single-stranded DNA-binding protein [Liberibacter crescens BT-1]AMC12566.1 single-stranded DNA-binding protein [Liberibacter crescens]